MITAKGLSTLLLLFLVIANALNVMLTHKMDKARIKGIPIPKTDKQHTHKQFVDDTNIVIEAKRHYFEELFAIFRRMGVPQGYT